MIVGIIYYIRSGCSWVMLPNDFGPHQNIYGWYAKLCDEKIIESFFVELKRLFYLRNNRKIKKLCSDASLAQYLRKNELTSINPRNKNKNTLNRFITTDEKWSPIKFNYCKLNSS